MCIKPKCLANRRTKRSPQVGCDLLGLLGREVVASLVRWLAILTPRTVLLECYAEGFNSVINRRVRHMEPLGNSRAEQIPRRRRSKEPFFACPVLDLSLVGGRVVAV